MNVIAAIKRLLAFAVLAATISLPAQAQWERIQVDWTGENGIRETTSRPGSAHPLQFYLTPSAERDFDNSLCLGCDMYGHRLTVQDFTTETSQREIGKYRGKKIVEVVLSFRVAPAMQEIYRKQAAREHSTGDVSPESYDKPLAEWKSILIEASVGTYRELYFLVNTGSWIRPLSVARVLSVGGAQVLVTFDPFNFQAGGCTDGYWILESAGPSLIDFSAVQKEVEKVIPRDAVAMETRCDALLMDKLLVTSPVQEKNNVCHSCGYLGTAEVHFRLDGNRAIPVSSLFVPDKTR